MKFLKRFTCTEDERLSTIKNKVYKECLYLVIAMCFISIFIKFVVFHQYSIKNTITELVIILVTSVYNVIRLVQLGVYSEQVEMYDKSHKTPLAAKNVFIGIILGVVISFFFAIRSTLLYGKGHEIFCFIIVLSASFMIYGTFFVIYLEATHAIADSISRKQSEKHQRDE